MEALLEGELAGAFQQIAERPQLYQRIEGNVRRMTLSRFPFSIYYRKVSVWIEVIAIVHQARDPRVWQRRIHPR
jgi:plasmid stabilization system protein ParE